MQPLEKVEFLNYLELLRYILIKVNSKFNKLEDGLMLDFAFKWLLCLFSQNITNQFTYMRLLDYLIYSPPIMAYIVTAIVSFLFM
jgi:hypothetical protein